MNDQHPGADDDLDEHEPDELVDDDLDDDEEDDDDDDDLDDDDDDLDDDDDEDDDDELETDESFREAIREFVSQLLHDAEESAPGPTPRRYLDVSGFTGRVTRARSSAQTTLADRLQRIVAANPDGCSIMIASTVRGCGAYGRLTVDPQHSTEVRLFGWSRLTPSAPDAEPSAIEALEVQGFALDEDGDWVWRVPTRPEMVPVAAHAAQRAISSAWRFPPHEATDECIRLYELDSAEMMLVAAGLICRRCIAGECVGDDH